MSKRLEKFTKGNWYLGSFCTVKTHRGAIIADTWHFKDVGERDPEQKANAILISKAPKMYYKLKEMEAFLRPAVPLVADELAELLREARGEKK